MVRDPGPAPVANAFGEVSEWSKVPDSKSGVAKVTEGSNPSLSASAPRAPAFLKTPTRRVKQGILWRGVRVAEGA